MSQRYIKNNNIVQKITKQKNIERKIYISNIRRLLNQKETFCNNYRRLAT